MRNTESSEHQLLGKAAAALREKDRELANRLFAEYSELSVARDKARAANDPG